MRIIDADKLLECVEVSMLNNTHRNENAALCHVSEHRHFIKMIVEQPTAFDVEKVIAQLKECIESSMNGANDVECAYWNSGIEKAIEIVERGGRDEE